MNLRIQGKEIGSSELAFYHTYMTVVRPSLMVKVKRDGTVGTLKDNPTLQQEAVWYLTSL